jgi:hypothetical protein
MTEIENELKQLLLKQRHIQQRQEYNSIQQRKKT